MKRRAQKAAIWLKVEAGRAAEIMVAARRDYAAILEKIYLAGGADVHATVHGSKNTTLRLKWNLASRATADQLGTPSNFSTWRILGFNRVELRDGYDYSVYWDLD